MGEIDNAKLINHILLLESFVPIFSSKLGVCELQVLWFHREISTLHIMIMLTLSVVSIFAM